MRALILILTLASCDVVTDTTRAERHLGSGAICIDVDRTREVICLHEGRRLACLSRGSSTQCAVIASTPAEAGR